MLKTMNIIQIFSTEKTANRETPIYPPPPPPIIEFVPPAEFPKQTILSKKEFCLGSDVYFIWRILTFDNQAFFDQVMKT